MNVRKILFSRKFVEHGAASRRDDNRPPMLPPRQCRHIRDRDSEHEREHVVHGPLARLHTGRGRGTSWCSPSTRSKRSSYTPSTRPVWPRRRTRYAPMRSGCFPARHERSRGAAREIAREEGLPDNWLNEQRVSAIPRTKDRRAPVLFESRNLLITGASKEHLIAMKMEAGRAIDIEDLITLLNKGEKISLDRAVRIHESLLPDSRRKREARGGMLNAPASERAIFSLYASPPRGQCAPR